MPRTCQWPTNPDDLDAWTTATIAGNTLDTDRNPTCGTRVPSFQATLHIDSSVDPLVVAICDVHAPKAEAAGWEVGPYLTPRTRARLDAQAQTVAAIDYTPVDAEVLPTLTVLATNGPDVESHDPELVALAQIADILGALPDDSTCRRVASWVADRYGAWED